MDRFTEKVVVITGAGDLAAAAGIRILEEKGHVAFIDFSEEALGTASRKMTDAGFSAENIMTAICDVRSQADCDAAMEKVIGKWGKIDAMIATAGIIRHMPIDEMSDKDWQDVIDINLTGIFHCCKAVIPSMKTRGYGHIVLISSIGGRAGRKGVGVNYAASKAGVNGIAMNLAMNLAPWHITVNSVAPGPLRGKMFDSMSEENKKGLASGIPLGRVGELSEAAAAAAYLASDDASWTTGEVLDVNGGIQY